jgi:hypothetical protein
MTIELVYAKSLQGQGACNEEAFDHTTNVAWVMDGATGIGDPPREGLTAAARFVGAY